MRSPLSRMVVLAASLVVVGCGAVPLLAPERTTFWEAFEFGPAVTEMDQFETLLELEAASDAVVMATVTGVRRSRVVGDEPQSQIGLVCVDVAVETTIAGTAPPAFCLEFVAGDPADVEAYVQQILAPGIPREPALIFLHEKRGQDEAGLFRVTNSTGLWAATARAAFDTPLRAAPPAESRLYADELIGIDNLSELIALVRRI